MQLATVGNGPATQDGQLGGKFPIVRNCSAAWELRPVNGVPKKYLSADPTINKLRGLEVDGSVRDNVEQARHMSSSGLGTTNEGSHFSWHP